jgi:hypothetical protein
MNGRITSHDIGLRIASGQTHRLLGLSVFDVALRDCWRRRYFWSLTGPAQPPATSVHHWTRIRRFARLVDLPRDSRPTWNKNSERKAAAMQWRRLAPSAPAPHHGRHSPSCTNPDRRRPKAARSANSSSRESGQRAHGPSLSTVQLARRLSPRRSTVLPLTRRFLDSSIPSLSLHDPLPPSAPPQPIRPPVRPISKTCHPPPLHPPLPLRLLQSTTSLLASLRASFSLISRFPLRSGARFAFILLARCVLTFICRSLHPS